MVFLLVASSFPPLLPLPALADRAGRTCRTRFRFWWHLAGPAGGTSFTPRFHVRLAALAVTRLCLRTQPPCMAFPYSRPWTRRRCRRERIDPARTSPRPPWLRNSPTPPGAAAPAPGNSLPPPCCPRNSPSPTLPGVPRKSPRPDPELRPQPRSCPPPSRNSSAPPWAPRIREPAPAFPRPPGSLGRRTLPTSPRRLSPSLRPETCHPSESPLAWELPPTPGHGSLRRVTSSSPHLAQPGKPLLPPKPVCPAPEAPLLTLPRPVDGAPCRRAFLWRASPTRAVGSAVGGRSEPFTSQSLCQSPASGLDTEASRRNRSDAPGGRPRPRSLRAYFEAHTKRLPPASWGFNFRLITKGGAPWPSEIFRVFLSFGGVGGPLAVNCACWLKK